MCDADGRFAIHDVGRMRENDQPDERSDEPREENSDETDHDVIQNRSPKHWRSTDEDDSRR